MPTARLARPTSSRRVLPRLLPTERAQVEEAPDGTNRLCRAATREVGTKDLLAFVQEDVEAEVLSDAEVL